MDYSNDQVNWTEVLTGEILLFGLLGKLLYVMPSADLLHTLVNEDVFSEVPFGEDHPQVLEGLRLLQSWSQASRQGDQGKCLEDLISDYTRLFIGPGHVLAAPWESVYFNDERLVFQERTLKVRNWYRRYGLVVENLYHEPDDHIGLELAFLSHLARTGQTALEAQDEAQFHTVLDARLQFLMQHPLKWAARWNQQVQEHAKTDFYRGVALLATGALSAMASAYQEMA